MGGGSPLKRKRRKYILRSVLLILLVWYYFSLPSPLFEDPFSTVVMDESNYLLGARIASDEQWRFPQSDSIPEKFKQAIIAYEDQYFYYHPGFNPVSLLKALWLNISKGKIVSGGSTLSMQLIRLSRHNPPRTVLEKLYEIVLATRLELAYSKTEILNLYAFYAPFGGNVVGLEAAAWRYFGRNINQLSWAEIATLAVLPNAPGLIHPGRNRSGLENKRNTLLLKLMEKGNISESDYRLALLEPLPEQPQPLPDLTPHLTDLLNQQREGKNHITTISYQWQQEAQNVLHAYQEPYTANGVHNGAIIMLELATGEVKAYVGNYKQGQESYNDMLQTARSSGSILKPFLYNSMLEEGLLYPKELLKDVPTFFKSFKPENFLEEYDGAVAADEALSRSLNIPAVFMLQKYGVGKFKKDLQDLGFSTIARSADNYGLSLILGGAEIKPWDLAQAYYLLAKRLSIYEPGSESKDKTIPGIRVLKSEVGEMKAVKYSAAAVYHTFEALKKVNRPDSEMGWQYFRKLNIAWKTGTSFGFRDAWAVGITPTYLAVVWIGNADGEGRPGLIGAEAAGPVLFDLLNQVSDYKWFTIPYDEMQLSVNCAQSGLPASEYCVSLDSSYVPYHQTIKQKCPYHKPYFTDMEEKYLVNRQCTEESEMKKLSFFVLPPVMAWYYSRKNRDYKPLPEWKPGCNPELKGMLDIIYPEDGALIFLPRELDGLKHKLILEVAHQQPNTKLFWHLNGKYIGQTEEFHQMPFEAETGDYKLLVEDGEGRTVKSSFKLLNR